MKKIEEEIRRKRPRLGLQADYKNSRAAAIELNCLACVCGVRKEVVECKIYDCAFWKLRPGADPSEDRPKGAVPSRKWYEKACAEKYAERKGNDFGRSKKQEDADEEVPL